MAIQGYLSEFSLAEIFQLLEQGDKTGMLTIRGTASEREQAPKSHYIWFKTGRIVAAADRTDGEGLIELVTQRGWLGDRSAEKLAEFCGSGVPLGSGLKSCGVLQVEQLKLLFFVQVMQQVCALFGLDDGVFTFESGAELPLREMTGLSKPATELTLVGLRALKNWSDLIEKLPAPTSTLISMTEGQPSLPLNPPEQQVWGLADGTISLNAIAEQLPLPLETVQKIAFRLIVSGLAEEIPLVAAPPIAPETPPETPPEETETSALSSSFLQNLTSFLRTHG